MLEETVVHHERLRPCLRERYAPAELDAIEALLQEWGALQFDERAPGLVCAAGGPAGQAQYGHVWVRDSVYVAQGRWERGDVAAAARTATALLAWFASQAPRFEACIDGSADRCDPMQRPHLRFLGQGLQESAEPWPHDQNDALGVALWFLCRAILSGLVELDGAAAETLARIARWFDAMAFWQDADAGTWEEGHELRSSSVGAVLAGLVSLRGLARSSRGAALSGAGVDADRLDRLAERGRSVLRRLLPDEFHGEHGRREVDAAQLFLVWPLRVVDDARAEHILSRVRRDLVGPLGIRRYRGDSFWMADYKRHFGPEQRTAAFGPRLEDRDRLLRPGSEAQWTLFDPILSVIHGRRFVASGDEAELAAQTAHFNRALGQLTGAGDGLGEGVCPEAWYLEDSAAPDRWVANDATPLYWSAANLGAALSCLRASAVACEGPAT